MGKTLVATQLKSLGFLEKRIFQLSLPVNVFFQWCAKASNSIVQKKFIFSKKTPSHLLCVCGLEQIQLNL